MTASASQTSLCQRSLAAIGGKSSISSVFPSDGSVSADACNLLYLPTQEQLSRVAWWDCLAAQQTLSLLGAAPNTPEGGVNGIGIIPPTPWLYVYARPPDCLKARSIIPTFTNQSLASPLTTINNSAPFALSGRSQVPFKAAYAKDANGNPLSVILTNQGQAKLNYTINQPIPTIWDSQFEAAFVASLAVFLVPALAMNLSLMNLQLQVAKQIIEDARAGDANEGISSQNREADWIVARSGGSNNWRGDWAGVGLDNMAWPETGDQ